MLTVFDLKVLASKIVFIPLVPLEAEQEIRADNVNNEVVAGRAASRRGCLARLRVPAQSARARERRLGDANRRTRGHVVSALTDVAVVDFGSVEHHLAVAFVVRREIQRTKQF